MDSTVARAADYVGESRLRFACDDLTDAVYDMRRAVESYSSGLRRRGEADAARLADVGRLAGICSERAGVVAGLCGFAGRGKGDGCSV